MAITNGYCTLAQLKATYSIATADTVDDVALEAAISSASRLIDKYTNRFFYSLGSVGTPATFYYSPKSEVLCHTDDFQSLTEVAVNQAASNSAWATVFAATDYMLEPVNAPQWGEPYTSILAIGRYQFVNWWPQSLRLKGVFGWAAVPEQVRQACLMQASRIYMRGASPFGIAGTPDIGVVRLSNRLDADVQVMLSAFVRTGGMVL